MDAVFLALGMGLLAMAAVGDLRTRRIPNGLTAGTVVLAALRLAVAGDPMAALHSVGAGAVVFAVTFLLFCRGWLGGGDAKLMAATALLVGWRDVFGFLFAMSLCGALLAASALAGLGRGTVCPIEHEEAARLTVPYGVAIAAAGILTLLGQMISR